MGSVVLISVVVVDVGSFLVWHGSGALGRRAATEFVRQRSATG